MTGQVILELFLHTKRDMRDARQAAVFCAHKVCHKETTARRAQSAHQPAVDVRTSAYAFCEVQRRALSGVSRGRALRALPRGVSSGRAPRAL